MLLGKTSYKEIRRRILEVDFDHPTIEMLKQLIKHLPEPKQIKELGALKEEYDDQFIVTVGNRKFLNFCENLCCVKMKKKNR